MIPRTINPHIDNPPPSNNSPKFGGTFQNSNGPRSPQLDRQSLLDQIINNCQRAQSPINSRKSFSSKKNNLERGSFVDEREKDKENLKTYLTPNTYQKIGIMKKQLQESNTSKTSHGDSKEKYTPNFRNSQAAHPPIFIQTEPVQNYQYYPKSNVQILHNSPTYKFKTNAPQFYRAKARESVHNVAPHLNSFQSQPILYNEKNAVQEQKLRKKIQQERQKHIEHCKKQERKLRLFYVQLQNKLCEIRNRQLKSLAQYQAAKLKQLDTCLKSLSSNLSTQQCNKKLHELSKQPMLRVNQDMKPQISGCLTNGVNGVYFSFDQSTQNGYDCNMNM